MSKVTHSNWQQSTCSRSRTGLLERHQSFGDEEFDKRLGLGKGLSLEKSWEPP
jgi:hypothetical protein